MLNIIVFRAMLKDSFLCAIVILLKQKDNGPFRLTSVKAHFRQHV